VASTRARTYAPWSASKVQSALLCPRLFHYRYVEKLREPEVMPEARIGKAVHAAIERCLQGAPLAEALLAGRADLSEPELARYEALAPSIPPFLERIDSFRRRRRVSRTLVEFNLAVREDSQATQFYAGDAYYRGVLDAGYLFDDGNLALVDHKTGFRSKSLSIVEQLEGYAVLAAASFRSVRRVWLGVHWVGDAEVEWAQALTLAEVRRELLPKVMDNIEAAALAVHDGPRPNAGVWCYRCNYRSVCPAGHDVRFEPVDEDPDPWYED
jgi:hypothetical protein